MINKGILRDLFFPVFAVVMMMTAGEAYSQSSASAYFKVNSLSELTDGSNYLIVYQKKESDKSGYALDGNEQSASSFGVTISNGKIENDGNSRAFKISASGSNYVVQGVGNGQYLSPQIGGVIYSSNSSAIRLTENANGFRFSRSMLFWNYYLSCSNNGGFQSSTSSQTMYLYKEVALSFPQSSYMANIYAGNFTAPTLSKTPSNISVVYSSSKTNVATVNSTTGAITLRAKGETVITATYSHSSSSSISVSYTLKVVDDLSSPNLSIWLNGGNSMNVGNTVQVGYYRSGNGKVSFASSNPQVVTIDQNGNAKSVGKGTAVITVTVDASGQYMSESKSLEITVVKQSPYLWFQTKDDVKVVQAGETLATQAGGNGDGKITYSSSNEEIATVDENGVITGITAGTVTIYATKAETDQYDAQTKEITITVEGVQLSPKLTFSSTSNEMYVNDDLSTSVTREGKGAISYTTSNGEVATVSALGVITARKAGTVTITAKVAAAGDYRAEEKSLQIVVRQKEQVLNFGLKTAGGILLNTQRETTVSRLGNGAITYTSSNTEVATIDGNGIITGKNVGNVTITASVAETNEYKAANKAIEVSVISKPDPKLQFSADGSTTISIGNTLKTNTSHLGMGEVLYSSSAPQIASVDEKGVITGQAVGEATITVRLSEDDDYASAEKSIVVKVEKRTASVTPSFTTKSISKGNSAVLNLLTDHTGVQKFRSDNPAIATVNATTGEIVGVSNGTTQIYYSIAENSIYKGVPEAYVTIIVSDKLEPAVVLNPSSVSLAVGGEKEVTVELGDYSGTCTAVTNNNKVATVSVKSHDEVNHIYVFRISGISSGDTHITLSLEETGVYLPKEVKVPVTVLNLYQYRLTVVDPPATGVSIQIWGSAYTGSAVFNSSYAKVSAGDVNVDFLPGYSYSVAVNGRDIVVTYTLKTPTHGNFFRLKSFESGKYVTLSDDGKALAMSASGMDNILYYDESGHLLFYKNGQFVTATNKMASVANASQADVFTFHRGEGEYNNGFCLKSSTGKYLLSSSTVTTTGTAAGSVHAYWYVEMLESLPVNISAGGYGYASLYCPVPLEVPGGVSAYYIGSKTSSVGESGNSSIEYKLHLTQIMSVIPAGTPVILVGVPGTIYQCPIRYDITDAAPSSVEDLYGQCASQESSAVGGTGTIYALQAAQGKEKVGFYPWAKSYVAGFRCYFVESGSAGAAYYRFAFEDESSTDVDLVEEQKDTAIYNICGQKVSDSLEGLPRGIYVRGGRKIVVR